MNSDSNMSKTTFSHSRYLVAIPFFIGLGIALVSPTDVLKYGLSQAITEIASYIFPTVRKMKGDYELGQVAKLYFSTMWLMGPFIFIGCYREMQRQAETIILKCAKNKFVTAFFAAIFFPIAAIAIATINFESNDLNDVRTFLTFHSRWGMPIWGFVMPAGACAGFALTAFWGKNFPRIFD
jgi:hypothetical protein